jgi:hypothetical protein
LPTASAVKRTDYDGAWKEALDRYFEPFLRLCFPAVHAGIDWSRAVTPMDQEWALTRPLYERGCSKEDILELFRLIDWLVQLPQEQEVEFRRQVAEYEAQKHMPYITSIERLGRQEGWREGAIITRQHAVLDALEIRFGEVADAIRQRIEAVREEPRLRALHKSAIQAGSVEEFTQTL